MDSTSTVLVLGCGYLGEALARLARARKLAFVGTVRDELRAARLRALGLEIVRSAELSAAAVAHLLGPRVHVVVAFPPDGLTDAGIAPSCGRAASVTYISTTAVYGDLRGEVNDATVPPPIQSERGARLLAAEASWRSVGATILRCPAIYGRDRGLHIRIRRGEHRIGGDGTTFTSRIHVDDLAQLVLAAPRARGDTFVVGDLAPATQNEIAAWVTAEYGVPLPPHVPIEEVHETLRSDRRVDGSRALHVLGVALAYPSYEDGMAKAGR